MADNAEALILQVSVDLKRLEKSLNSMRGQTNSSLGNVEKRFDQMNAHVRRSGDAMARDLRSSIAAIGIGVAIREVTGYADAWTTARNKLAAAGVEQSKLAATLKDLSGLAQATRSDFEGTVDLYAKLTRAGQKLNLTQEEVRRITETTLQAFVAGGAAASEQAAAITQLSQALGSGVLQGDELKSIRENAPLLAQAIADEFKTTIAGLKDLGAEGKLTADRVAKAILNANGITDAFSKTITTTAQAVTNLQTAFTRYIGESRTAQSAMQALGGFLQFVTDNIEALANAAIIAAAAIGTTLAAVAMARFVKALLDVSKNIRSAETAMQGLRLAMTFFSGPVGVAVVGIAAALGTLALNAADATVSVDDVRASLDRYQQLQNKLVSDTGRLQTAQEALNEAIRTQGEAAQDAARAQVQGIRDVMAATKEQMSQERLKITTQLQKLQQQDTPARGGLGANLNRTLNPGASRTIGETREELGLDIERLGAVGQRRSDETVEDWYKRTRDYLNGLGRKFTALETEVSDRLTEVTAFDQNIRDLKEQIAKIDAFVDPKLQLQQQQDALQFNALRAAEEGAVVVSSGGSGSKSGKSDGAYRTNLEKLNKALKDIGVSAQADTERFTAAAQALDHLNELRKRYAQFGADLTGDPANIDPNSQRLSLSEFQSIQARTAEQDAVSFKEIVDGVTANSVERSRIAVAALLDLANSKDGLAEAFAQLPGLATLLTDDDKALVRKELGKMAQDATDAVATGFAKIEADHRVAIEKLNAARKAAMAAGIDDAAGYYEALAVIERDYVKQKKDLRQELLDKELPALPIFDSASLLPDGDDIAKSLHAYWIKNGFLPSDAQVQMREAMTDSVKRAFNDGIRTGDWGDSFTALLADAITTGLDQALNTVGAWLSNSLFGKGGLLEGLVNGATQWAGSVMFGRAAGGPVYGGQVLKVGENGPETLVMGRGQTGQVLNASMTRDLRMGGAGTIAIDASMNIYGNVDAPTWPKIQAAMQAQARQIMSAVPGAVNATITDNRIQKRRL